MSLSLTYVSILSAAIGILVLTSNNMIPKSPIIFRKQAIDHFCFGRPNFGENSQLQAHLSFGQPGATMPATLSVTLLGTVHKLCQPYLGGSGHPPHFVSDCQQLAYPPSPLCQRCQHLATPPLSPVLGVF